jgi:uncharacterized protein YecT (DUF1311 family)
MRLRFVKVCVALAYFLVGPAHAGYTPQEIEAELAWCEKTTDHTQVTVNGCAGIRAAKAELRLNEVYRDLRLLWKTLGDTVESKRLLLEQRTWVTSREESCRSDEPGTMMPMLYAGCMQQMAEDRTDELQDMLQRACASARLKGSNALPSACSAPNTSLERTRE